MTAMPPDPDPDLTPGLEPGGGVRPGETPPDSGSTTPGISRPETYRSRTGAIIWLTVIALFTLSIIGFIVAQVVGWISAF
jgi:hypothetical protein